MRKPKTKPEQIREEVKKQIQLLQAEVEQAKDVDYIEGLQRGLGSLILISNKL